MTTATVKNYNTGETLEGTASEGLIEASESEGSGTGAVPAYRDDDGVWHYVPPAEVSIHELRGETITTVFVD